MRERKSPAQLQRDCAIFNKAFPVGSEVLYEEVIGVTGEKRYTTRSYASILSGHTAVVWLEGKSGCVCIDHCKPAA
jgi:hypothetical protein